MGGGLRQARGAVGARAQVQGPGMPPGRPDALGLGTKQPAAVRPPKAKAVLKDSGVAIGVDAPPLKPRVQFGRLVGLVEGSLCGRIEMYARGMHNSDRKGVSGNAEEGADSVVLNSNDAGIGEEDSLTRIVYAATKRQGAGALALSFKKRLPIRVFRSSSGTSIYAPEAGPRVLYRYDGLYHVTEAELVPCGPRQLRTALFTLEQTY